MNNNYIVTLSQKGQFTLPAKLRRDLKQRRFLVKIEGDNIFLMACEVVMKKQNFIINLALTEKILALNDEEKLVYNLIRQEPMSTNDLIAKTSFGVSKLNIMFAKLEFEGLIKRKISTGLWSAVELL